MIIDYGSGGRYPGMTILGLGSIYGWFGIAGVDIVNYLATIRTRVAAPDLDIRVTAPRITARVFAPDLDAILEP